MALLLRKDVQKASYYVWFLGAEESRALRGKRILMSAIPYIVDRSQEIDPIKVTLQVSHKGMKIVQVSFEKSTKLVSRNSCFIISRFIRLVREQNKKRLIFIRNCVFSGFIKTFYYT